MHKMGGTNYQVNNCGDSQFADNVFQINDAVSWIKGKHSFKFGGEIRMLQFNVRRLTTGSGEFDLVPRRLAARATPPDSAVIRWPARSLAFRIRQL